MSESRLTSIDIVCKEKKRRSIRLVEVFENSGKCPVHGVHRRVHEKKQRSKR